LASLLGLGAFGPVRAQTHSDPRKVRPLEGDIFVYAFGARAGETVRVSDLEADSEQVVCWAMDPATGFVRDGSRLNQVLLVRFAPEELSEATRAVSAEGIVAYSGICPHTGCDISNWARERRNLLCSCHDSEFDPRDQAVVKSGPAPRRLPALPIRIVDGVLEAAGGFDARIRFEKTF
jgi:Rieske Fe-S protein